MQILSAAILSCPFKILFYPRALIHNTTSPRFTPQFRSWSKTNPIIMEATSCFDSLFPRGILARRRAALL